MINRAYLASLFRWSTAIAAGWSAVLGAGIGMAGPIALGAIAGDLPSGYAGALGGLLVSGAAAGSGWRGQTNDLIGAFWPTALAAVIAAAIAGQGWTTEGITISLALAAGAIGGYSGYLALATTRFIAFLVIAIPSAELMADKPWFALMVVAGAAATVLLGLIFGAMARAGQSPPPPVDEAPQPTTAEKFTQWRKSLGSLHGWQYAIRIAVCLTVASVLRWIWPDHHVQWVAITIALVAERQVETFPVKVTQRAIGTVLGVLATALFFTETLPVWALVIGAGVLAGARPWLKARNYFAYAVVMTPLIIFVVYAGRSGGISILADRLGATLVAVTLVIATNAIAQRILSK